MWMHYKIIQGMKKHCLLALLICLQTTIVFGQAEYLLFVKINATGVQASCEGQHKMEFEYKFHSGLRLNYFKQDNGEIHETVKLKFSIDEKSEYYSIAGENKYDTKNGFSTCRCCGGANINNTRVYTYLNSDVYKRTSYSKIITGIPEYGGSVEFSFSPANLKILDTTKRTFLQNDTITILATTGFPADAYTWQYTVDGDSRYMNQLKQIYYNLPTPFQGKSKIDIKGTDLLGPLFQDITLSQKHVILRLVAKDRNGKDFEYSSIKLYPKLYAPSILSVIPQTAKCSDSKTSSVIIQFNRPIGVGRTLEVANYLNGVGSSWQISDDSLNANYEYVYNNLDVNKTYEFSVRNYFQNGSSLAATYYVNPAVYRYTLNLFPPKLETKLQSSGVYCYGGKDGTMYGQVQGGTSPFILMYNTKSTDTPLSEYHLLNVFSSSQWINDPAVVTSLQEGAYKLITTDRNGCVAMDSLTISQPAAPLAIISRKNTEVSGYGLNNGSYEIKLKGGTTMYPEPELKSSTGTIYTGVLTGSANNEYSFRFDSLPAADYSLRAIDNALALHALSIKDSAGCMIKETLTILQPPPLTAHIEQTTSIKCAGDKTATLIANGKGGKPFVTGRPYKYQWSFSANGILTYTSLSNQDSILKLREAGFYRLLMTDQNNNQVTKLFQINQPDSIQADILVKNVTCMNWTDGGITVNNIRGGNAPLSLYWLDGQTQTTRTGLPAGAYPFTITDAKGCMFNRNPVIKDTLNGISITENSSAMPVCYGEATGSLSVTVQVESPPYNILWNTGATTSTLTGIGAGTYRVQVTNSRHCVSEASFVLANPTSIAMDLDTDKYLCNGQAAVYDLAKPGYEYVWTGPDFNSTSGNVRLTTEGTYTVSIKDPKGCKADNAITIHRIDATIAADFVIPSQVFAGQEVSLVNITNPSMQDSAYWAFDTTNIDVIHMDDVYATLVFKQDGVYRISLHTRQGDCTEQLEKEVLVKDAAFAPQTYAGTTSFIREFEIRPNPSDGNFEVMIRLQDIASVKLTLVDVYSKGELARIEQTDQKEYLIPMHVQVAAGTYMLFLETPYGVRVIKVIII